MFLYKYSCGKIIKVEATETKKTYRLQETAFAFNYYTRIDKSTLKNKLIGLSKKEALQLAYSNAKEKESEALLKLNQARIEKKKIKSLIDNF